MSGEIAGPPKELIVSLSITKVRQWSQVDTSKGPWVSLQSNVDINTSAWPFHLWAFKLKASHRMMGEKRTSASKTSGGPNASLYTLLCPAQRDQTNRQLSGGAADSSINVPRCYLPPKEAPLQLVQNKRSPNSKPLSKTAGIHTYDIRTVPVRHSGHG